MGRLGITGVGFGLHSDIIAPYLHRLGTGEQKAKWLPRCDDAAVQVPLVIAGEDVFDGRAVRDCLDPSRPGVVVGRYRQATDADVARAVECAADDPDGWRSMGVDARWEVLGRVAQELRLARGDLMGAALADGGKTLMESDPEVSEAIDFLEFYRDSARWWQQMPTLRARPKGVVVVVPPWNFPVAIPCGGVAAALAAGNTVIIKPASDTVLVAWEMCQCFWRAGVPKTALQFVPCSGGREGRKLVNNPQVGAVILTGGTGRVTFSDTGAISSFTYDDQSGGLSFRPQDPAREGAEDEVQSEGRRGVARGKESGGGKVRHLGPPARRAVLTVGTRALTT